MKDYVTHYTNHEGGIFNVWPFYHPLEYQPTDAQLQARDTHAVTFYFGPILELSIKAHSLLFKSGQSWDCVNGWRAKN
jgi:hypothetical protein